MNRIEHMDLGTLAPAAPTGGYFGRPRTIAIWAAWHLLAAICIPLLLSAVRLQVAFWEMPMDLRVFLGSLTVTYLAIATAVTWLASRRAIGLVAVFIVVTLAFAALFVMLRVLGLTYSRSVLAMAAGASFVFAAVSLDLRPRLYKVLLPAVLLASAGLGTIAFAGWPTDEAARPTTFYRVRLTQSAVIPSEVNGGALEPIGSGILAAAGDGGLFYLGDGGAAPARSLPYRIPLNRAEYIVAGPENAFGTEPYRIGDILVRERDGRVRVFASHHYWHGDRRCVAMRVSSAEAPLQAFVDGSATVTWQTVYETNACLPLGELRFEQNGGGLLDIGHRTLLVAIGDHSLDGFYAEESVPQDPDTHFGKTVRIDLDTGRAAVFTTGHRNPTGLHRTADGRLWMVEHGPQGGDELNLLHAGTNYGWPLVTYGVAYGRETWPPNARQGRHLGYTEPVFAWVPSIAVNSLTSVQGERFPIWKGDLIVGGLHGDVFRVDTEGDRVVLVEPIYRTGGRLRDLTEGPDGRIVMLLDDRSVRLLEPEAAVAESGAASTAPSSGERLYQMCQDCHRIGSGAEHGVGPDLAGIVGRDIAGAAGFDYSAGLDSQPGAWTPERLHEFLEDPEAFAPGTSMRTDGISDPGVRQQLIDYIQSRR